MKGEKVRQTTLEDPLMISESCLMSWLVLVMILLVCCCMECLPTNEERKGSQRLILSDFFLRSHNSEDIMGPTWVSFKCNHTTALQVSANIPLMVKHMGFSQYKWQGGAGQALKPGLLGSSRLAKEIL